jgi:hypothetical protein
MLSLARRAIATAKCSLPARAARGRPKEDPARLRKVRELLLTQAGVNVCTHSSLFVVCRLLVPLSLRNFSNSSLLKYRKVNGTAMNKGMNALW